MQLDPKFLILGALVASLFTEVIKIATKRWKIVHDFIPISLLFLIPGFWSLVAWLYARYWVDGMMEGLVVAAIAVLGWSVVVKTITGAREVIAALFGQAS